MQFVTNGPDIPEALLEAHEEGRVVFFCGAGISYPAGLPGFKGLVDQIYNTVGDQRSEIEQEAYERNQFDATLDLLEKRLPGQRIAVRRALAKVLKPKLRRKGATDTHVALLQLSRCRDDGAIRLVTTNFDLVFEHVAKRTKQSLNAYAAPMLPIPKSSRWDGIVYLHGLLPKKPDENALNRLVLTSGDFGLAYLTERWASRFVSELFRNYVVCFVGYSINDPVLRYMMDALAADRMMGEVTPQAYALADCEPGQEHAKTVEWKAKGVTPILYEVPTASYNHSALHNTLKVWAETYRDGILGKERIVVEYALGRPTASTLQDDFVGRMLWALSHKSGLPAKRFAEFNPAPSLDWLTVLSEPLYQRKDLNRFGVMPNSDENEEVRFSFFDRFTPYKNAPRMGLVTGGADSCCWDDLMIHLSRWLLRHLNDPALIIWLSQRGGQLHQEFSRQIDLKLNEIVKLEREGKMAELDEMRSKAPNAIPNKLMQTLWRLFLTGRVKLFANGMGLHIWRSHLERDGLTPSLRINLREILSPRIALKKPLSFLAEAQNPAEFSQIVSWEIVLADNHTRGVLRDLAGSHLLDVLHLLLNDFQLLLTDVMDLQRELGAADNRSDNSCRYLPSITAHGQNSRVWDWVVLIELLRDSWLSVKQLNPLQARQIALGWFDEQYPVFKRLALFAAAQDDIVDPTHWIQWLASDGAWWLWSPGSRREVLRLLVLQGAKVPTSALVILEEVIIAGPPRDMFRDDLDDKEWQVQVDRSVWLYLAKLQMGGARLSELASLRLNTLSAAHPNFKLTENEQDEFLVWFSSSRETNSIADSSINIAPRRWKELFDWLQQPPLEPWRRTQDPWRDICRSKFFHSILALRALFNREIWLSGRWGEALQAWSDNGQVLRSWRYAAVLVQRMSDTQLSDIIYDVTRWMEEVSKVIDCVDLNLLTLCRRIMALPLDSNSGIRQENESINDPVSEAINHPIGHIAQVLLNVWFSQNPQDNESLPEDIEPLLTQMCEVETKRFRHARVMLAWHVISLFRVDKLWAKTYLLPLFDWGRDALEARAVWDGFLLSPRIYPPLLLELKSQFLETANHYVKLGENKLQFTTFLTFVALDHVDGFTSNDFKTALNALPPEGLGEVASALLQAIQGSGQQEENYWRHRIKPFWQEVWPKHLDLITNGIAETLANLCVAASGEFESAFQEFESWLQPIEYPGYVIDQLFSSNLCTRFPLASLRLLDAILKNQRWVPEELRKCLDAIVQTQKELQEDPRYRRLDEFARAKGI